MVNKITTMNYLKFKINNDNTIPDKLKELFWIDNPVREYVFTLTKTGKIYDTVRSSRVLPCISVLERLGINVNYTDNVPGNLVNASHLKNNTQLRSTFAHEINKVCCNDKIDNEKKNSIRLYLDLDKYAHKLILTITACDDMFANAVLFAIRSYVSEITGIVGEYDAYKKRGVCGEDN